MVFYGPLDVRGHCPFGISPSEGFSRTKFTTNMWVETGLGFADAIGTWRELFDHHGVPLVTVGETKSLTQRGVSFEILFISRCPFSAAREEGRPTRR